MLVFAFSMILGFFIASLLRRDDDDDQDGGLMQPVTMPI